MRCRLLLPMFAVSVSLAISLSVTRLNSAAAHAVCAWSFGAAFAELLWPLVIFDVGRASLFSSFPGSCRFLKILWHALREPRFLTQLLISCVGILLPMCDTLSLWLYVTGRCCCGLLMFTRSVFVALYSVMFVSGRANSWGKKSQRPFFALPGFILFVILFSFKYAITFLRPIQTTKNSS